jgi:molecular chaperone DnaJ
VRCEACSGRGFKNECIACLGASYILRDVKDSIYIEKGTQDKCILKVEYKGHSGFKADNGHLYVTVLIEEDERFRVDGNNIHSEYELDFLTATFGGVAHIETVHGSREVAIEAGTQSGTEIRIFNVGLKSPFSKRMGDQVFMDLFLDCANQDQDSPTPDRTAEESAEETERP